MSTHVLSHTYTVERWDFHTGRQANSQTNTHMYTTRPKKGIFFSFSLSRLNKQTQLRRSLYSCNDFCVSVCFNLNGFQVLSLPKSASPFSPLILLTLKHSSSPALTLSLSLFLTFSPPSRDITVRHLSLSPLHSCFSLCFCFFFSLSLRSCRNRNMKSLYCLILQSGG